MQVVQALAARVERRVAAVVDGHPRHRTARGERVAHAAPIWFRPVWTAWLMAQRLSEKLTELGLPGSTVTDCDAALSLGFHTEIW